MWAPRAPGGPRAHRRQPARWSWPPEQPGPAGLLAAGLLPTGLLPAGLLPAGLLPAGLLAAGLLSAGLLPAGLLPARSGAYSP